MRYKWLVIDANGLAWRAFHSTGGLSYNNVPTGVAYGLLGEVLRLQGQFNPKKGFVFCFDKGPLKRSAICKEYKYERYKRSKEATGELLEKLNRVRQEIERLRTELLPLAGYRNVYSQEGMEADDIIASVCLNLDSNDRAIIVSSDKDMFQLLSKRVSVWRPREKELWTSKKFRETYGIKPKSWITVKSLAGCSSDEVKGIRGVGELTAIKYLRGELKGIKLDYILSKAGKRTLKRNWPLIALPYEGCKQFKPKRDKEVDLNPVYKRLGIKSLAGKIEYKEKR